MKFLSWSQEEELKKELSSLALSLNHLILDDNDPRTDMNIDVTFDTTLPTINLFDKWFNPSHCGHIARTNDSLFYWLMNLLGVSLPNPWSHPWWLIVFKYYWLTLWKFSRCFSWFVDEKLNAVLLNCSSSQLSLCFGKTGSCLFLWFIFYWNETYIAFCRISYCILGGFILRSAKYCPL